MFELAPELGPPVSDPADQLDGHMKRLRIGSRFDLGRPDAVAMAALALLVVALVAGGASRVHELRLAVVELASLPLLLLAGRRLLAEKEAETHRFALGILLATACLPLIQLIPLPPAIWTRLPGREGLSLALRVTGLEPGFVPLSLTPDRTWRSVLALLPPVAMFLGVLAMKPLGQVRLVQALTAGAFLSLLLGAAQIASGGEALYLWATTAAGNMAGFFANRNHLATLCLMTIPFVVLSGAGAVRHRSASRRLELWTSIVLLGLITVSLGVIRSRAGVILFGPVLSASLLAAWLTTGGGRPRPAVLALAAVSATAAAALGAFGLGPLIARFDTGGSPEGRFENWPVTYQAAETYLPLGSGFGSFDAVFRSVEPRERLDSTFFNQAHNDYLETLLEAGLPGGVLIVLFLVWFGRRALAAWRSPPSAQGDLQKAAAIAIGAVLLHSAFDYPLRTATLAAVFALCCGLLETFSWPQNHRRRSARTGTGHED